MKREIKFRAWDIKNKKMCYPNAFMIYTGSEVLRLNPHHEDNNYYQIENCEDKFIQMQFTGLEDSKRTKEFPKGQDIYEGDTDGIGIIVFEDGCFWYDIIGSNETFPLYEIFFNDFKIKGNIHQNRELLI